ncbi:TetR family transcriptional regulator [Polyangium sp. 15x6]|uniref:TetR/AcrR family transcriptional regulator n=1 Tax=Polyangium sp. 15x6 TaxID=3042687 RepID=UPI0032B5C015
MLDSARAAFTRAGYDGVGVREIATGAGVTAMLVNRYFGSKESLFAEVVDVTLSRPGILTREITTMGHDVAALARHISAALVDATSPTGTPLDGFLIMLRSASSPQAAAILRDKFEAHFEHRLVPALPGDAARERASLMLALIAGLQLMRQVIAMPSLTGADPCTLEKQVEALFRLLIIPNV